MRRGLIWLGFLMTGFVFGAAEAGEAASKPSRIVSLNVCTDELLVRLADPENIAGITRFSLNPKTSRISREAARFKTVRGRAEEVLTLNPDLVLAESFTHRETLEFLKKKQIPLLQLPLPKNFEDIRKNILTLSHVLGEESRGAEIVRGMEERLRDLRAGPDRAVGILFLARGGQTAGAGTFEHAVIEAAGAKNVAAEIGLKGHGYLSLERLILAQPDIILFSHAYGHAQSLGHEMLSHPVIRKGLTETAFVFMPSQILNCGTSDSVDAVAFVAELCLDFQKKKRQRL